MDGFQLTFVTRREHIQLTFGFHHSIAHSFRYLETKIQTCDVTRTPVRPQNIHGVNHQLSDANMNYRIAVYFYSTNYRTDSNCSTVSYTLNRSFKYFCRMYMKLCQVSLVSFWWHYLSLLSSYYDTGIYAYLYCRIQAKIIKAKAFLCLKMAL